MADNKLSDFDASFLKDLADIIKNKTLFFIPFFGAFLAFLFAKTDYIKSANFIIWIAIILLFLAWHSLYQPRITAALGHRERTVRIQLA